MPPFRAISLVNLASTTLRALCVVGGCAFAIGGQAAVSSMLFPLNGAAFDGAAGNIVFDGVRFVTPVVGTNGSLAIRFLSTNGVTLTNYSLSVTGSSPRIATVGNDYLLSWLAGSGPFTLAAARIHQETVGAVSYVASNVEPESVCLSAAGSGVLTVWQSAEEQSRIYARTLDRFGIPTAAGYGVSPGGQAQRYPSCANDGTNHLVAWMEQNTGGFECGGTDYWRVAAQHIGSGGPTGLALTISQTNSLQPHRTDCSYGTNYLVVWSANHRWSYPAYPCDSIEDFAAIHGRMVSDLPQNNEFVITANPYWNTNAAVASGGGRFVVTAPNSDIRQTVQPLALNGSRQEWAFPPGKRMADFARIAYGAGRYCVIYSDAVRDGYSVVLGSARMTVPALQNVRRTAGGGIAADCVWNTLEVSTNLVTWNGIDRDALPTITNAPQLFVRAVNYRWRCIDQLRSIEWAKLRWAFENLRDPFDTPTDCDLFCFGRYLEEKPACPENGTYTLGTVETKPACTIAGHALDIWPTL